jgi:hypothetical protein
MTNYVELVAQQQLSGEKILNALEFSDKVQPVSCAPLEVAAEATARAAAATEAALVGRGFNQWIQTAAADIGVVRGAEWPAGLSLTSGPMALSGLLEYRGALSSS